MTTLTVLIRTAAPNLPIASCGTDGKRSASAFTSGFELKKGYSLANILDPLRADSRARRRWQKDERRRPPRPRTAPHPPPWTV